jgi:hypothetical protein
MTRSIIRTATIAIAVAALAAPTALARPADTPPAAAKAEHQLDLRSPDARDAARRPVRQAEQHQLDLRSPNPRDAATRPAHGSQANPPVDGTPQAAANSGVDWTTIGLGVAASLLAIGAITGITRRTRRTGRARITA